LELCCWVACLRWRLQRAGNTVDSGMLDSGTAGLGMLGMAILGSVIAEAEAISDSVFMTISGALESASMVGLAAGTMTDITARIATTIMRRLIMIQLRFMFLRR